MIITETEKFRQCDSDNYKYIFDKVEGTFIRWGRTVDDDPEYAPFGPEIADIEVTTSCGHGCEYCVPNDTAILTPDGLKKIVDIRPNDVVKSISGSNVEPVDNVVKEIYCRHYTGKMIKLELDNKTILYLTPDHKVRLTSGVWIEAKNIKPGDDVIYVNETIL